MIALVRFAHLVEHDGDQKITLCGDLVEGEVRGFYDPPPPHELNHISSEAVCRKCYTIHLRQVDADWEAAHDRLIKESVQKDTELQVKQKLLEVADQDLAEDMAIFDKIIAVLQTVSFPDEKAKKKSKQLRKALDEKLRDWNEDYGDPT